MQEQQLTPKEKFDQEMKGINKTLAPEKAAGFTDEEVNEHEEEVEAIDEEMQAFDKSMGETKIEVTKEQFAEQKQDEEKRSILNKLAQAGGIRAEKLSPENEAKMQNILKLERDGKLKDPVLKHMIGKKVKLAQQKLKLDVQAREMQQRLVEDFAKLADETMKCISSVNAFNQSILEYLDENQDSLEDLEDQLL